MVYSLGFNSIEEETGCYYNCEAENLTCLFVITSFGGIGIIVSTSGTKTTKMDVIFLLCPFCARKYNEDPTIETIVVEEFKSHYKDELDKFRLDEIHICLALGSEVGKDFPREKYEKIEAIKWRKIC